MSTGDVPLIGLAHGSRDPRAALAVRDLMAAVARLRPGLRSAAAFLDLSEPDLPAVVRELGAPRVVVVPLLFGEAFHARVDVPGVIAAVRERTGATLTLSAILGLGPEVLRATASAAVLAGITDDAEILLLAVGSSRVEANAETVDFAQRWSARRTGAVHVGFATCEPYARKVLSELRTRRRNIGLVPLFLAPGLLLEQVLGSPEAQGIPAAAPLGPALAELVLQRYDEALAESGSLLVD